MTGPLLGQGSGYDDGTTPPTTKEQIEGRLSALRSLVKEHNSRGNVSPIRLNFDEDENHTRTRTIVTGKEIGDADLKKPFKETIRKTISVGFSSAANSGEWPMPVWCRIFQQTLDGNARGLFERFPEGSINEWAKLRKQFTTRFSTRRACFKDPTKITKIVRKENETLVAFKERWTAETGFILGVPEVMKISSFMDAHKCPELAKWYYDKVPKTVDEMMVRLDDFVRSEEAFANTELPRGEVSQCDEEVERTS
ncbi:hypothetical protein Tco_0059377 [Tanacetum coccineum]